MWSRKGSGPFLSNCSSSCRRGFLQHKPLHLTDKKGSRGKPSFWKDLVLAPSHRAFSQRGRRSRSPRRPTSGARSPRGLRPLGQDKPWLPCVKLSPESVTKVEPVMETNGGCMRKCQWFPHHTNARTTVRLVGSAVSDWGRRLTDPNRTPLIQLSTGGRGQRFAGLRRITGSEIRHPCVNPWLWPERQVAPFYSPVFLLAKWGHKKLPVTQTSR